MRMRSRGGGILIRNTYIKIASGRLRSRDVALTGKRTTDYSQFALVSRYFQRTYSESR